MRFAIGSLLVLCVLEHVLSMPLWSVPRLRVGSLNVENLGSSKASKDWIMQTLAQIICRYDVISILEVRDSSFSAIADLNDFINQKEKSCSHLYTYRMGKFHGSDTSNHKEQIVYFFRPSSVELLHMEHIYEKGKSFARPPLSAVFRSTAVKDFTFMSIAAHLRPKHVPAEMNALHQAYSEYMKRMGKEHQLSAAYIIGDLNCDKPYVRNDDWKKMQLAGSDYMWLIRTGQDTMVTKTDSALDRIIMHTRYQKAFDHSSPHIWDFSRDFFRGDVSKAREVSNHWPIGFDLICKKLNIDYGSRELAGGFFSRMFSRHVCEEAWNREHSFQAIEDASDRRKPPSRITDEPATPKPRQRKEAGSDSVDMAPKPRGRPRKVEAPNDGSSSAPSIRKPRARKPKEDVLMDIDALDPMDIDQPAPRRRASSTKTSGSSASRKTRATESKPKIKLDSNGLIDEDNMSDWDVTSDSDGWD